MSQRHTRSPRPDTLFPSTTLFRSHRLDREWQQRLAVGAQQVGVDPGLERLAVPFDRLWRRPRRIERHVGRHAVEADDGDLRFGRADQRARRNAARSEEHTSELQSLMRISYAVLCLKKKN